MSKAKAIVLVAPWAAVIVTVLTRPGIDVVACVSIVAMFATIILSMVLE